VIAALKLTKKRQNETFPKIKGWNKGADLYIRIAEKSGKVVMDKIPTI